MREHRSPSRKSGAHIYGPAAKFPTILKGGVRGYNLIKMKQQLTESDG